MRYTLFEHRKDELVLVARVLLMILFVIFGWSKLTNFSGTVSYMAAEGTPVPTISAVIAIFMEFFVGLAELTTLLFPVQLYHEFTISSRRSKSLGTSSASLAAAT
jgi:hypothetical protein